VGYLIKEQDEMMKMAADSKVMLFSPRKEALQVWKHCGADLWSLLQDLMWTTIPLTKTSCQLPKFYHTCRCIHNVVQDYRS
jgi:hypothetical protein